MLKNDWFVFKDIDKLSEQLARDILKIAEISINLNNSFKIVLSGGNSVINLYKILSISISDWSKWHIYLGDERCLPIDDKDRNDRIIKKVWIDKSQILKKNIHFICAELGAKNGALHYQEILNNVGCFDVVLLSMGEDGHTSSLFPNHLYDKSASVVVECNSPKHPKNRISISYSRFNQAKNIFKIISGSSKQKVVKFWLEGKVLPINKIYGESEKVFITKNALKPSNIV
jgi:6-phosphogluconolactonase